MPRLRCFYPHDGMLPGPGWDAVTPRMGCLSPVTYNTPKSFHLHLNTPVCLNQNWARISLIRAAFFLPLHLFLLPTLKRNTNSQRKCHFEEASPGKRKQIFPFPHKEKAWIRVRRVWGRLSWGTWARFLSLAPRLLHGVLLSLSCLIMTETLIDSFGV